MNTLRKLEAKWFEAAATEFLAEEDSDLRGILTSCASKLSAELPKWERLLEAVNDVAQFNEPKDASDTKALARLRAALKEVQE